MPFCILRICSPGDVSIEGPDDLLTFLVSNITHQSKESKVSKNTFVYSANADSRIIGNIAKTNMTVRKILNTIEAQGWNLIQCATTREENFLHELYVFHTTKISEN